MPQPPVFSTEAIKAMIREKRRLTCRIDSVVIAEPKTLSAQYVVSLTTMSQRLWARVSEVDQLNNQVFELHRILVDKDRKNKILKHKNNELIKLTNRYASDLQPQVKELERERERAQIYSQQQEIIE